MEIMNSITFLGVLFSPLKTFLHLVLEMTFFTYCDHKDMDLFETSG